jgi:starch synthase
VKVLFASSELAPLVRVGGLAYAAAGMAQALRDAGVDITVVIPDYGTFDAELGPPRPLQMPGWVGITTYRRGTFGRRVPLIALRTPEIERSHPYTDDHGRGWPDNDFRFMAFAAAVARIGEELEVDVLHVNDWHAAAALGFQTVPRPSALTIHNLAYQGSTHLGWLDVMTHRPEAYEWYGTVNPLSGAIALADRVITVSENYAREIQSPANGAGLDEALRARSSALTGILNGIDTTEWNPATDRHLAASYDPSDMTGKAAARRSLLRELGWDSERSPLIGIVTRLTWQKGVDLALEMTNYLDRLPARLVLLGSGERRIAEGARWAAAERPHRVAFIDGFDEPLAHRIFGGADLLLMPSRFEPCGLAQMQAMIYGTIPVVTGVGGLRDTVIDADADIERGTGFIAATAEPLPLLDALHRASRGWRSQPRRKAIQQRGMTRDWSWRAPAARQIELYESMLAG